jgi:NAD+ kinase
MKLRNVLVVYTKPRKNPEKVTLNLIQKILKKNKINYKIVLREKLNKKLFENKDLILVVGGDGTFLMASHFVFDKTLMFGVNADPSCKEGFFMSADKDDFEKKFNKIRKNKFKVKKLYRLEAFIGKKKIPELALNEFYVASEKPYHTARYYINIKGKKERQKSSGVLVSTAAGSYAWVKSAGGKALPLYSDSFEYIIREPYCGRTAAKCKLLNQVLKRNEKVVIEFEVGKGIIIADSTAAEYRFKAKQKVTVKVSDKTLSKITFN